MGVAEHNGVRSNFSKSSGKWYFEISIISGTTHYVGVATAFASLDSFAGSDQHAYSYHDLNGRKYTNGSGAVFGDTYAAGDVIGVALDLDNDEVFFSKNGVWQDSGDPFAGTDPAYSITDGMYFAIWSGYDGGEVTANFGASAFFYVPPAGFSSFGSGSSTITWDSGYAGSDVRFTNNDLTAHAQIAWVVGTLVENTGSVLAKDGRLGGKWYWEVSLSIIEGTYGYALPNGVRVGIGTSAMNLEVACGDGSNAYGYDTDGLIYTDGVGDAYGDVWVHGDVIGVALDLDNHKIWFSKNGVWQSGGDPVAGTDKAFTIPSMKFFPVATAKSKGYSYGGASGSSEGSAYLTLNVGDTAFSGSLPTGFLPYNSAATLEELTLAETTLLSDDISANVEYGAPETIHEATLSEGFTTADEIAGLLPGESESPASGTSGESFTMDDSIEGDTPYRDLDEGMTLSANIEGDTPYRDLDEGMTLDDALSSAESEFNATNAEHVVLTADIEGGLLFEGTTAEGVTTSDDISVEKELGVAYQPEGFTTAAIIEAVKSNGALVTEIFKISETLQITWIKSLESTAEISDEVSIEVGIPVTEVLTARDEVSTKWSGTESVTSTLGMFGTAVIAQIFNEEVISEVAAADTVTSLHRMISAVTSSLSAVDSVSSKLTCNPEIFESIAITGILTVLQTLNETVNESVAIEDSLGWAWLESIEDGVTIADTAAVRLLALHMLTSDLVATDTAVAMMKFTDSVADTLGVAATVAVKQFLQEHITEVLNFGIVVELDGDLWECWVLNTNAFHASVYSGFSFNSYAVHNNTAYGCKSDGIYKLSGSTDDGSAFKSGVVLPESRFGTHNFKRFRKAYFGLSGSAPAIKLVNEDGTSNTYAIRKSKVTPTRGVKGREWTLSIEDFDSLDFIELAPIMLTR